MSKRWTLNDMHVLANSKGGKCLSTFYKTISARLQWECQKEHDWFATGASVKRGSWCPACAGRRKTITDMKQLATARGGKCLSKKYVTAKTKLTWQCKDKHVWDATPDKVKRGSWCPFCAGRRKTIMDMGEPAESMGGKCLSQKYIDNRTKLIWQCREGHKWSTVPKVIIRGGWCPHCAGTLRSDLLQMQQMAQGKGGRCLSRAYANAQINLLWECKEKHTWEAKPNKIQQGRWCPICSIGVSERICSKIFEELFGKKFDKSKPTWLVNESGNRMELDGYSKQLGIAFEYQGEQHYKHTKFFHQGRTLEKQKKDDARKRKLCNEQDVILITIPHTIKFNNMKKYIIKKCLSTGIFVPKRNSKKKYCELDIFSPNKIKEMHKLASKRKGKFLSKNYINNSTKLQWGCHKGHTWLANSNNIRIGHWCPYCAGRGRTISDMQKLAKAKNGKCLSDRYITAKTKLTWQCKREHIWEAIPDSIRRGSWCPYCAGGGSDFIQG